MSREISGLRLLLHSSDSVRLLGNYDRRYLRYGVLLIVVLAGILATSAVRTASGDAVAFLQSQSELVQNTTVVLIASAFALVVLGTFRRVTERSRRSRTVSPRSKVLSVTSETTADFWRAQEEERKQ